jgi:phosphate transport system protein
MERHFDEELGALKDTLVRMAGMAETMIGDSIRMLVEGTDSALAAINENEDQVNRLQCEVDDICTKLIALHQPTASDLRFILGCIKTNGEIERLADEAVNVSHKAKRLGASTAASGPSGGTPGLELLAEMGRIASGMVRDCIRAYVSRDSSLAREVILRDERLNELKAESTRRAKEGMASAPSAVQRGMDIVLAARNIERMGDHAKNVAENTIFVAEGRDVRHYKACR